MQIVWASGPSSPIQYKGESWKGLSIPQVLEFLLSDVNHDQASFVHLGVHFTQAPHAILNYYHASWTLGILHIRCLLTTAMVFVPFTIVDIFEWNSVKITSCHSCTSNIMYLLLWKYAPYIKRNSASHISYVT